MTSVNIESPFAHVPRVLAVVLIGIFLLATVLGLCLTYGPPSGGW